MTNPRTPAGDTTIRATEERYPDPRVVRDLHRNSDLDSATTAQHHTLGIDANAASPGNHSHDGRTSRKVRLADIEKQPPTVTGSRGANEALQSLLNQLQSIGLIINNTSI